MLKNENRPGYKKTTLGQLVTFSSGGTPPKAKTSFWGGTHPWVSAKDMKSSVIYDSLDTLTDAGFEVANIAPKNALLILVRGMTLYKKVPVCLASKDMAFNQDLKALVPSKEVLPNFLLCYLLANESELLGLVDSAGHGTGRLNTDLLRNLPVYLPPLPEQSAIAEVLECWDKATRALQKKIYIKQQIRKGLHQKIFSSHPHQQSTSKSWKSVRLGKIVDINKGQQLNRLDQTCSGEYPVLNGGVEPLGYTDKWNTEKNTITISEGGNSCGFVNFNTERFWCGGHCYTLDEDKEQVNKLYLFQYLKHMQSSLMRLRVGSGLPNIQKKMLAQFEVLLPSIGQQLEIAKLMSAVDSEIMALEKKLALLKDQKNFLLNNLVTGTIRLPQFKKTLP